MVQKFTKDFDSSLGTNSFLTVTSKLFSFHTILMTSCLVERKFGFARNRLLCLWWNLNSLKLSNTCRYFDIFYLTQHKVPHNHWLDFLLQVLNLLFFEGLLSSRILVSFTCFLRSESDSLRMPKCSCYWFMSLFKLIFLHNISIDFSDQNSVEKMNIFQEHWVIKQSIQFPHWSLGVRKLPQMCFISTHLGCKTPAPLNLLIRSQDLNLKHSA